MAKITGRIDEIIFHNEENGYTVMLFETNDGYETAVGHLHSINIGENLVLEGELISHARYGKQFKIDHYEVLIPTDLDEIEHYLASGLIHGVGPQMAKRIVDHFGTEVFNILDEDAERLMEISGIGLKKYESIMESYKQQRKMKTAMIQLQKLGVSNTIAMKLYKRYGDSVVDIVLKNPYRLADDISGIGFKYVDHLASTMGIEPSSPYRLQCGVKHVLTSLMSEGHTFAFRSNLVEKACQLLNADLEKVEDAITEQLLKGELSLENKNEETRIYLTNFYNAEVNIAKRIIMLASAENSKIHKSPQAVIDEMQLEKSIQLAEKQEIAIMTALKENVMILTGGPGTGKTTIIDFIIQLYDISNRSVLLAAPTGRAAKRMTEATGLEAKTIHRLIEYTPQSEEGWSGFNRNEENPLEGDLIIVDEMSMVDLQLMNNLLRAIKVGTRLIMVGDPDQLQSVGSGDVLADFIKSETVPVIKLDEIFRQSEESMIVHNAHKINRGEAPTVNRKDGDFFFIECDSQRKMVDTILNLCKTRLPEYYDFNPIQDIQILSPMKASLTGVENLNAVLQENLNPASESKNEKLIGSRLFREGDKVMQIKNNYSIKWQSINSYLEGDGVFNGDIGRINRILHSSRIIEVIYDDERLVKYEYSQIDEITHAYAITVHKSQGSEFPVVVMPICGSAPLLMTRNILYTAITRAAKLVVLVGHEHWLKRMINNNNSRLRNTGLAERLIELYSMYDTNKDGLWGML